MTALLWCAFYKRFNFVAVLVYYLSCLTYIAKPLFSFLFDDSKTKMKEAVWLSETTFYPLLVLELSGMIILYSRKELKTFTCNCHLNHKRKFTKVNRNYPLLYVFIFIGHTAVGYSLLYIMYSYYYLAS